MRRFKPDKVEKVREVVVFTAVACFIVSQVAVLAFAAIEQVSLATFQLELCVCSVFIILVLNVSQVVIYFNLTGSPYKSLDYFRKVRKIGIVAAVWSVAFAIKFLASFFGDELY